jgi:hypothetical protein
MGKWRTDFYGSGRSPRGWNMGIDPLFIGIRLINHQLRPLKGGGTEWLSGDVRGEGKGVDADTTSTA